MFQCNLNVCNWVNCCESSHQCICSLDMTYWVYSTAAISHQRWQHLVILFGLPTLIYIRSDLRQPVSKIRMIHLLHWDNNICYVVPETLRQKCLITFSPTPPFTSVSILVIDQCLIQTLLIVYLHNALGFTSFSLAFLSLCCEFSFTYL